MLRFVLSHSILPLKIVYSNSTLVWSSKIRFYSEVLTLIVESQSTMLTFEFCQPSEHLFRNFCACQIYLISRGVTSTGEKIEDSELKTAMKEKWKSFVEEMEKIQNAGAYSNLLAPECILTFWTLTYSNLQVCIHSPLFTLNLETTTLQKLLTTQTFKLLIEMLN